MVSFKTTKISSWWMAIRPHTLPAAISPVIVAWSITYQQKSFSLLPALAAMFSALMIQIISNLVNDVMDFNKGADTEQRQGFKRVTQSGLLSQKEVWGGVVLAIILAFLAGSYLIWLRGYWVLLIGVISILSSIAYTAGPFPLAYNGFGDLFVLIFFGFVNLCGSVFVIMSTIPSISWVMAFNMGALITAILVVNNIRDIESDRKAGRRNIPIVYGLKVAFWEYRALIILPYILLLFTAIFSRQFFLLMPFLSFPFAIQLLRDLPKTKGAQLNKILGQTAQLVLRYGVLLAIGFLLS
ncbi:MAG: 1,4-dihydroxy-2-naphthoate polyprenyltransferase [Chloroflexi bacterium]|nr:1,4-dihydroxy-2-naphthoate polyprenyltransferase [Chloroflexota bacterium]MBT3669446.1 1,4-dihydroxy-2-naphthoate polyprenyltransferase [Chloroflexota bacterium]MBT4304535.1 1,4-dihydroxy-2-naphthoate polyprenyltransferase [Chloroflexota bacterium]MBT4534124.1 1,4-dihydroxy-2-naphthoate polyprenyltransferase [Chloroflexota bacterium]MBT4683343.1 1,4-dihydroxy-2-naphthoate polyprenyltransferase [Chloroflexota bacterium]